MITGHKDDGVSFVCFEGTFIKYTTTGGRGHGVGFKLVGKWMKER